MPLITHKHVLYKREYPKREYTNSSSRFGCSPSNSKPFLILGGAFFAILFLLLFTKFILRYRSAPKQHTIHRQATSTAPYPPADDFVLSSPAPAYFRCHTCESNEINSLHTVQMDVSDAHLDMPPPCYKSSVD